ncbi:MAG: GAF domain-containing sensor histidine kinase [Aggregatilineales bacterium]
METLPERDALNRRNRELSILNDIAQALNRATDMTDTLHTVLKQVIELFDMQTGWIWLMNDKTGKAYLAAVQNLPDVLTHKPERMDGSRYCYCLDTYKKGDLEGAANVSIVTCTRLEDLVKDTGGLLYHASIPLYAHERKLGMLNVVSADWCELSDDELRLLYTVGEMLSMAIERSKLYGNSLRLGMAEERLRLSREIHDTLAQGLTGITLQLETADALIDSGADLAQIRGIIQQALSGAQKNLHDVRRSVMDLRAAPLEGRTIGQALETLAQEVTAKSGMALEFQCEGDRALSPALESGIYRIAQEALNNVVSHAKANTLFITLTIRPDNVHLHIDDDGIGFDSDEVFKGHFGLIGMNERANLLDGSLEVCSTPNVGTSITVDIPMKKADRA